MTTFPRGFRLVSSLSIIGLAVGCGLLPKKDGGADAAPEAEAPAVATEAPTAAPAPAAALPAAVNENDVSRFPDEQKLENVSATLLRAGNVREIPGLGKLVAPLPKGTAVTQLSQRSTYFLVAFDNPKDQKRLMGWLSQDAFAAVADAGVKLPTCTAPETLLFNDNAFCGKICESKSECPEGQACKGHANKYAGGKLGTPVGVCTVYGTQPVVDAGAARVDAAAPVVDAAAPVVDAAAPAVDAAVPVIPPIPTLSLDVVPSIAGKCPAGYTIVAKDSMCHKNCSKRPDSDKKCQGGPTACIICNGALICSAKADLCK